MRLELKSLAWLPSSKSKYFKALLSYFRGRGVGAYLVLWNKMDSSTKCNPNRLHLC